MAHGLQVWVIGGATFTLELDRPAEDVRREIEEGRAPAAWLPAADDTLVRADAIVAMRLTGHPDREPTSGELAAQDRRSAGLTAERYQDRDA